MEKKNDFVYGGALELAIVRYLESQSCGIWIIILPNQNTHSLSGMSCPITKEYCGINNLVVVHVVSSCETLS